MKRFTFILFFLSLSFLIYSSYKNLLVYNSYYSITSNFDQITKEDFDLKTKKLAQNLDNQLIDFFSKKTFLIGTGSLNKKYIKINQYNKINLIGFSNYQKKETNLLKDIDSCLKEKEAKNGEGIKKSCIPILKKDSYLLPSRSSFINFFNDEYKGDYFIKEKEKNKEEQTDEIFSNYDYIYKVKNKYCKYLENKGEEAFFEDYISKNKEKEEVNKILCEKKTTKLSFFSENDLIQNEILFFLLNKNLYVYPGNKSLWKYDIKEIIKKSKVFWRVLNKNIKEENIILKCYKNTISESILNTDIYKNETLDKNNIKLLQLYAKKKSKLITCLKTEAEIKEENIVFNKNVVQLFLDKETEKEEETIKIFKEQIVSDIYKNVKVEKK